MYQGKFSNKTPREKLNNPEEQRQVRKAAVVRETKPVEQPEPIAEPQVRQVQVKHRAQHVVAVRQQSQGSRTEQEARRVKEERRARKLEEDRRRMEEEQARQAEEERLRREEEERLRREEQERLRREEEERLRREEQERLRREEQERLRREEEERLRREEQERLRREEEERLRREEQERLRREEQERLRKEQEQRRKERRPRQEQSAVQTSRQPQQAEQTRPQRPQKDRRPQQAQNQNPQAQVQNQPDQRNQRPRKERRPQDKQGQGVQQPVNKNNRMQNLAGEFSNLDLFADFQKPEQEAVKLNLNFDVPERDDLTHPFTPFENMPNNANGEFDQPVYKKHSTASIVGGIIFYLVLIGAMVFAYFKIQDDLVDVEKELVVYEQVQPDHLAQDVFQQVFGDPNWAALYDNSGTQNPSLYEEKDAFVRYMENKVGNTPLTYKRLYNLSKSEICYGVFLDREKVATFTMKNKSEDPSVPDWKFGSVDVFYTNEEFYRVQNMSNYVVKVNGVPLDDSTLVKLQSVQPTNELGELKNDLNIPNICLHELTGLMTVPQVTMEDELGNPVEVTYDEETKTFYGPVEDREVPEDVKNLALEAMKTYCEFMIKEATRKDLSKYFNTNTDTYRYITSADLVWVQDEKGHDFANESVSNYIRYDSTTFSVHVQLTFQLTRDDNSIKESTVEKNMIFERERSGKLRCIRMTGYDLTEDVTTVRLKFEQDGNVLSSRMIPTDTTTVYCPDPVTPEIPADMAANAKKFGKEYEPRFVGWAIKLNDKYGMPYYQIVFKSSPDRTSSVPSGLLDEPVTVYPAYTWDQVK